jgi:hypothetical protein
LTCRGRDQALQLGPLLGRQQAAAVERALPPVMSLVVLMMPPAPRPQDSVFRLTSRPTIPEKSGIWSMKK